MQGYSLTEARENFSEIVHRARYGRERIPVKNHGKIVSYVVSIEDVALLERLEDEYDVREAKKVLAKNEETVPIEDVAKKLGISLKKKKTPKK